jgi:hypothetical protein
MALDFLVIGDDDYPLRKVGIGLREYELLSTIVEDAGLAVLARVQSYWRDARFRHEELRRLASDLLALSHDRRCVGRLAETVNQVQDLVDYASECGRCVEVVSD